jgi:hypothetical protein
MNMLRVVCLLLGIGWGQFWVTSAAAQPSPEQATALKEIRSALAGRDFPALAQHLSAGKLLHGKGNVEYDEDFNRLDLLAKYVQTFWEAVDQGAAKSLNAGELDVDGTLCAVVDYDRKLFVIRTAGENKRYTLQTIPPKLALVLSQLQLPKNDAQNKVCFGAFLAMDAKGDRRLAKQYWEEAALAGGDVKGLLPELAVPLAAPPIALPELSPQVRTAMNPAQWQLRAKHATKVSREPLGKEAKNNAEGWLIVPPSGIEESQVVQKTRVSGDFSCRVYFEGLGAGQSFGLYPAIPSETAVVVPLPEGRVKVELLRKKGLYYCRINDQDVELKPSEKGAEKLVGYLGCSLLPKLELAIVSFEYSGK